MLKTRLIIGKRGERALAILIAPLGLWRKCMLYPAVLAFAVASILMLALVPIKWTPLVAVYPEYLTWHQVSSLHLMKVLWRPLPPDVSPIDQCPTVQAPSVARKDVAKNDIRFFQHEEAKESIEKLNMQNPGIDFKVFLPILDKETKINLLYVYSVLAEALQKIEVSHVLLHGSLLGLHRFSTISPWDDDLDVAIKAKHWREVRDALSCIKGFELYVDPAMRWSFFQSNGTWSNSMLNKKYPFVDIFFQEEDDTHVWGIHSVNRRASLFQKDHVFPVKWQYLDDIPVPIPRQPLRVLESQYGDLSQCSSQEYGHLLPAGPGVKVSCSELYPVYGRF